MVAVVLLVRGAPAVQGVALAPVGRADQVLGADLGVMKVTAAHPAPTAIVPSGRVVQRVMANVAPMVIARRDLHETANAEVLVTGQNDQVARREMANADLTAIGQADLHVMATAGHRVLPETENVAPTASVRSAPVARRVTGSAAHMAIDPADIPAREASDLHAHQETESDALTASVRSAQVVLREMVSDAFTVIVPRGLPAMANADLSAAGRVARRLAGNGPSGSAGLSDGMTASEVLNFQIR